MEELSTASSQSTLCDYSTVLNYKVLQEVGEGVSFGTFDGMLAQSLPNRRRKLPQELDPDNQALFAQPKCLSQLKLDDLQTVQALFRRDEQIDARMQSKSNLAEQFVQQRKNQEDVIMKRRQELEKADPRQNDLTKDWQFTYLNNTIRRNDMDTLRPGKDINDTIINFYLVLLQTHYISPELRERVHCFNTYFITQLVGKDLMIDENEMERIGRNVPAEFEKRIERNYQNVQKWSKKADLFQKQLIVIPVNMPGHWCLIMVLRPCGLVDPKAGEPCILFLDSMNERNKSVVEAIRIYLQREFVTKNFYMGRNITINEYTLPDYQLLVPRQTNFHDCGLYMLSNVEAILNNKKFLDTNFSDPKQRQLLQLYPRSLIFRMRNRLYNLITSLETQKGRENEVIDAYLHERQKILEVGDPRDYDEVDQRQLSRYLSLTNKQSRTPEEDFAHRLTFYLKPDCNFFQANDKQLDRN